MIEVSGLAVNIVASIIFASGVGYCTIKFKITDNGDYVLVMFAFVLFLVVSLISLITLHELVKWV